ncbi:MAG: hypothetical protein L3J54_14660 [Draconibacterium sp.]|nr:hypothetical protein [Draconibacterium sp.]
MVKNISPFKFGQIVDSLSFTNRKREISLLGDNLLSGNHLIIISPRRYGKSSLVQQFVHKNRNNSDVIHCMVDLFSIHSEEDFYETLAQELIKSSSNKMEEWIQNAKSFFKHLIPRISISSDPINDFSISFDMKEVVRYKTEVLNLPEIIAKKRQKRVIIYLDEFQNIETFKKSLEFQKVLRSVWQKHKNVSYCMYGSKRHMMREIFDKAEAPFYRFGFLFVLDRIEPGHWSRFIVSRFKKTNKTISKDLAVQIAHLMKNHPHYVQQLAHFVWSFSDTIVTPDVINHSIEFMINSNSPLFIKILEDLSNTQINLLKAISKQEKHLSANVTMQEYNLGTPRNVFKNKKMLENKDVIDVIPGEIRFIDPLFEVWFKRNS